MGARLSRRAALGLVGMGTLAVATSNRSPVMAAEAAQDGPMPAGTIGLVPGPVARLSIVNHDHGPDAAGHPYGRGLDIASIDGELVRPSHVVKLAPGTGAFVDFAYTRGSGAGAGADNRLQIYGVLRHPVGGSHSHGGSVQVFSASTGETVAGITPCGYEDPALGQVSGAPNSGVDAGAGTIGMIPGQVARLSVVNHDHGNVAGGSRRCGLEIRAIDGKALASRVVELAPGTGAFVDFAYEPGAAVGVGGARRLEIYGLLRHPTGKGALHGGTLELFSARTGEIAGSVVPCGFEDPTFG